MSEQANTEWQTFNSDFAELAKRVDRVTTAHVNSAALRQQTSGVAQSYFGNIHPVLSGARIDEDNINELTTSFQNLLQLSAGRNAIATYRKYIKRIRKLLPRVTGELALRLSAAQSPAVMILNAEDRKIIATLDGVVASAGNSYRQVIADLSDPRRLSFRGPAMELREILREVLDKLTPDAEVIQSEGFELEQGRAKPTMKQKVRFILKARDEGKAVSGAPEDAAVTVEAMIGDFARSVYNRSSLVGHVATERKNVVRLKRFVDVALQEILEL